MCEFTTKLPRKETSFFRYDVLLQVVVPCLGEHYGENGKGPIFSLEVAHAVVVQLPRLLVSNMPKLILGQVSVF